ncbi:MAG: hypothetical protein WCO00_05835 [Rhodospirillaceae bacterium]
MSSLEKWREVALVSLGLPDDKLLGVLALVEKVPDRDQVREVLDKIRPRLVKLKPPRPITGQRLLFRPVEDLFDPPERYRARIGRLSRHTIHPCWLVVHNLVDAQLLERTERALKTIEVSNSADIYAVGLPFWKAAGKALAGFLEADTSIGRRKVGSDSLTVTEDMRQQLTDISDILGIAAEVETVKIHLPEKPIQALSEVDTELLAEVISRLGNESTRKVQTFILVVLARMSKPGDLLKVLAEASMPCTIHERNGLVKTVGTNALSKLAFEAQDLRQTKIKTSDPVEGTQVAEQMVSRLASLEKTLGGLRDRNVVEQIQTTRREIGTYVLDTLAVKADEALFENLRARSPEGGGKSASKGPTIEQEESAEKSALSLRRCARIAESVGVRREMEQKLAVVCSQLEQEATAPERDEEARERRLIRSVRLIELIAGPDEAQRVLMSQFNSGE